MSDLIPCRKCKDPNTTVCLSISGPFYFCKCLTCGIKSCNSSNRSDAVRSWNDVMRAE